MTVYPAYYLTKTVVLGCILKPATMPCSVIWAASFLIGA